MSYLTGLIAVLLAVLVLQNDSSYNVKEIKLSARPALEGPLAPNNKFNNAKLLFKNTLIGPESIAILDNALYVTNSSGIVKIANDKIVKSVPVCVDGECGRPLGIRHHKGDTFIVADAFLGLVSVNFKTGKTEMLLPSSTIVDGRRIDFADDFDFLDEETIILSDASAWRLNVFFHSLLELPNDGRLLSFNLKTRQVKLIAKDFQFSNGVQLHADKESVLVDETGHARVNRIYLKGPKEGTREIFTDNLPCLPDNIRSSLRGTYLIACAAPRVPHLFSFIDTFNPYPSIRKLIMHLMPESYSFWLYESTMADYGIFIEVDQNGKVVNSWHDTSGTVKMISEVRETKDAYYLGSYHSPFLAKLDK